MNKKGFTLIELLIVIGIIAILAAGVIVAINPGRQFAQARDATRESHINTLHSGLLSYQVSNNGNLSGLPITTETTEICNTNQVDPGSCGSLIDLSDLVDEGHLNQIPVDPQATGDGTGYEVAEGSIILVAPLAETRFIGIGISQAEQAAAFCEDSADYGTEGTIDGDVVWCDNDGNLWSPTLSGLGDATDGTTATFEWGCYETEILADSSTDGVVNTDTILAEDCMDGSGGESVAAKACNQLTWAGSNQGDWYLPAINTVESLHNEEGEIPFYDYNAESDYYWSSTEFSSNSAWYLNFNDGTAGTTYTKVNNYRVRCVRR